MSVPDIVAVCQYWVYNAAAYAMSRAVPGIAKQHTLRVQYKISVQTKLFLALSFFPLDLEET
eukprot:1655296-Rhodomonas_salina.1